MNFRCKSMFVLSLAILLAACDNEGNGEYNLKRLPEGTQVQVNPESTVWEIEPFILNEECLYDVDYYSDELVTIFVSDAEGKALGDVDLTVSIALAENTFSGSFPPVALYDDRNGDLIPDDNELVSGEGDPLLRTYTEEYTGAKNLIVRLNLSCPYRAELQVVAGGYVGKASFLVTDEDE